ncbi:MAG: hypothetical protein U0694_01825 [Anaerolineae bacterium]
MILRRMPPNKFFSHALMLKLKVTLDHQVRRQLGQELPEYRADHSELRPPTINVKEDLSSWRRLKPDAGGTDVGSDKTTVAENISPLDWRCVMAVTALPEITAGGRRKAVSKGRSQKSVPIKICPLHLRGSSLLLQGDCAEALRFERMASL